MFRTYLTSKPRKIASNLPMKPTSTPLFRLLSPLLQTRPIPYTSLPPSLIQLPPTSSTPKPNLKTTSPTIDRLSTLLSERSEELPSNLRIEEWTPRKVEFNGVPKARRELVRFSPGLHSSLQFSGINFFCFTLFHFSHLLLLRPLPRTASTTKKRRLKKKKTYPLQEDPMKEPRCSTIVNHWFERSSVQSVQRESYVWRAGDLKLAGLEIWRFRERLTFTRPCTHRTSPVSNSSHSLVYVTTTQYSTPPTTIPSYIAELAGLASKFCVLCLSLSVRSQFCVCVLQYLLTTGGTGSPTCFISMSAEQVALGCSGFFDE